MKEDDYNLENEIGNLGGAHDEPVNETANEPKVLGQLRHIPGQQEKLTDDEQASLDVFNSRTRKQHNDDNDIRDGWITIDRASMGTRTEFYPENWEFRVRCATVEAIKNWSSIDEESAATVNHVMNEIVKNCLTIRTDNGNIAWDRINSWDRFWFILKIREYTFSKGEQALEFDEMCDNCDNEVHFTLNADNLYYDMPDESIVDKHFDRDTRTWVIDPKEYNVDGPIIRLYNPTLQKDNAIIQWLYVQNEQKKNIDESFVRFLPLMLEKAPKDYSLLDRMIKDCYREYKNWSMDKFLFMDEIRRNIQVFPSEKLEVKCPNCGEAVRSTVQFPNGVKYLFAVQGRHTKFGTK